MGNYLPCVQHSAKPEQYDRLEYDMLPVIQRHLPVYWIMGPISSGKTKLSKMLSDLIKYYVIDVKMLVNDESARETERAQVIKTCRDNNTDIPNELTLDLIKEVMLREVNTAQGYIICSFPQNVLEAEIFVKEVYKPQVIFVLSVKFPTIMDRLAVDDSDLTLSTVQQRLVSFRNELKNIRGVFDHKIEKIDANDAIDVVFEKIQLTLQERFGMDLPCKRVEGHP